MKNDLKWITDTLDCGDNSCLFKNPNAGGMRTNGGCRCFKALSPKKRHFVHKLFNAVMRFKKESEQK